MRTLICVSCLAILTIGFAQRNQGEGKKFNTKRNEPVPAYRKMTNSQLSAKINAQLTPQKYDGPARMKPQLCARTPWISGAHIDSYHPGRWDTESNSVFFDGIHQTGSSAGEWDGTVGYVEFTPPSTGKYLILTHFTGYKMSCNLYGPWGTASSTTNTTSDEGVVAVIYTATNTNHMTFSFNFKSTEGGNTWGMGYWHGTEFTKI